MAISTKMDPLAFLLEDSQIKEQIEPYFMARIVDVKEFIQRFPFSGTAEDFHFIVEDSVAPWNNGVFGLTWRDGHLSIVNEPIGKMVRLDIQTLTCLMMNYRRASYLARIERITTDEEMVKTLERIIPNMEAYFSDYF